MADIFDKLLKHHGNIGQHQERAHGYYVFPRLEGEISNHMMFRGKKVIVWSTNNYLGLANHPEVRMADTEATKKYGLAYPMGSRMMTGNSVIHEQLEASLATFEKKEAAILLNYGYQGIMSTIDAIVNRQDIIIYDAESHACIIDAIRLHQGESFRFKHNNIADCEKKLQKATAILKEKQLNGGILIITEGVYGMAGDQAKLKDIIALKKTYPFRLLVDDAHGFGTLGKTGAGIGEEQNCQSDIDLYFATFAKSMASIGAFVAGDKKIINFIRYNIRSQIYAKSLPMPIVLGNIKRLELLQNKPSFKEQLWKNARSLQKGLIAHGFDIGNTESVVTPIYMKGGVEEATAMLKDLRETHHVFCSIVVPPVIPQGHIIYRLIPTSIHTESDIHITLEAFKHCKTKLDAGEYKLNDIPNMADKHM